jgi:hypothetical protein
LNQNPFLDATHTKPSISQHQPLDVIVEDKSLNQIRIQMDLAMDTFFQDVLQGLPS